jgi:hypothetical protein
MPTFNFNNGSFTPNITQTNAGQDCWSLDAGAAAGSFGKIVEFNWGGRLTTSTGYRTRWVRPTAAGTGTRTAGTLQSSNPNYATAQLVPLLNGGYATLQPALPADPIALYAQDWNAQGGVGAIVLPLANPWWVVNGVLQGTISCRNIAGVDPSGSTYGTIWEE